MLLAERSGNAASSDSDLLIGFVRVMCFYTWCTANAYEDAYPIIRFQHLREASSPSLRNRSLIYSVQSRHPHAYVWMVHQFSSEAPPRGIKSQFMSVAFSGVKNCVFTGDSDAQISGPENSLWWLVAVAKFDHREGWKFHGLNKLLPLAETGSQCEPNVAGILPHIQRT
jgi:hypothetical protein